MKYQVSFTAILLATALQSMANVPAVGTAQLRKGVFYTLTPSMASELGLDIQAVKSQMQASESDNVLVRVNELDELDLAVHSEPTMGILVADNMK